ncbi:MAG TPA: lactate racemase domain-containing protein [Armatimonadota bacterium]|nr:lactate racemase domain-containing protein [Armatimonadota bacterium]
MTRQPIRLHPLRQKLLEAPLADVEAAVAAELDGAGIAAIIRPGQRIAITAGSRGIASIPAVLRAVAASVRRVGADPFLVPAMGSHGGATGEGQLDTLAGLGVTPESVGAPILSSMVTVQLGSTESGMPVYLDKNAAGSDGIIVVNRIKQHTDYAGPLESGLMKMIAIGLGKRDQPERIHAYGSPGLRRHIPEVARYKIEHAPIKMGLALFEDGYERLRAVRACAAADIEANERMWIEEVRELAPRIPFDSLDLLIVEQIGKDISGAGLDTRVIGRMLIPGEPEPDRPRIERVIALDLTEATHGNGVGTGLCDFVPRRLVDRINWDVTYTNGIVSGFLQRCFLPIVLEDEKACVDAALSTLSRIPFEDLRIARIRSTLHLDTLLCSEALLRDLAANADLSRVDAPPLVL